MSIGIPLGQAARMPPAAGIAGRASPIGILDSRVSTTAALFGLAGQVEPESPLAIGIQDLIGRLSDRQRGPSALDVQESGLLALSQRLEPESPASIAIQAQLARVQASKRTELARRRAELALPGNDLVSRALRERFVMLSGLEPGSPQADQVQDGIEALTRLNPNVKPAVNRLLIDNELSSLDAISGSLQQIAQNLEPESPQATAIQRQRQALQLTSLLGRMVAAMPGASYAQVQQTVRLVGQAATTLANRSV